MIPNNIRSTAERSTTGYKILVYGPSGVGKTVLASTAPRPIFLDSENGTLSIAHKGIARWPLANYSDLKAALDWCANDPDARANFSTLVVDSISDLAQRERIRLQAATNDPRQAYGAVADSTISFMRVVRDLPFFNVIVLAHQAAQTDKDGNTVKVIANVPGKQLLLALPHIFDVVAQLSVWPNGTRVLRTQALFEVDAKSRAAGVLPEEKNPNLAEMFPRMDAARLALTAPANTASTATPATTENEQAK